MNLFLSFEDALKDEVDEAWVQACAGVCECCFAKVAASVA